MDGERNVGKIGRWGGRRGEREREREEVRLVSHWPTFMVAEDLHARLGVGIVGWLETKFGDTCTYNSQPID